MSKLPVISGQDAIRALLRAGYQVDRQTGSHIILRNPNPPFRRISVPNHRELRKGTLRGIIRQAGMSVEEFAALL